MKYRCKIPKPAHFVLILLALLPLRLSGETPIQYTEDRVGSGELHAVPPGGIYLLASQGLRYLRESSLGVQSIQSSTSMQLGFFFNQFSAGLGTNLAPPPAASGDFTVRGDWSIFTNFEYRFPQNPVSASGPHYSIDLSAHFARFWHTRVLYFAPETAASLFWRLQYSGNTQPGPNANPQAGTASAFAGLRLALLFRADAFPVMTLAAFLRVDKPLSLAPASSKAGNPGAEP